MDIRSGQLGVDAPGHVTEDKEVPISYALGLSYLVLVFITLAFRIIACFLFS